MRVKHPLRSVFNVVFRKAPIEAQLIVTRRCNLSCGYCTEYDKVSEMIPLEVLQKRIDVLHRLRVINIGLLGGEPLMHPDLPAIVAYGDRHSQVSVTTNGFLLTEDLIRRLNDAGLLNMEVSVDSQEPDPTLYIQKTLKTVRPKLELLRKHAAFHVIVNLVLCEQTKTAFRDTVKMIADMGFVVSIDLLHGAKGAVSIGGPEYLELWEHHYSKGKPFMYLEQDYGTQLLKGNRPKWRCQAGARFMYVDEFGKVQFCSAQRGRLGKPILEYTREDLEKHSRSAKGCEAGCSLLCHYRDSAFDNQPVQTIISMAKLLGRGPSLNGASAAQGEPERRRVPEVAGPRAT
jgi:molybdenum cofactor biosynthesis enzyme MoaA